MRMISGRIGWVRFTHAVAERVGGPVEATWDRLLRFLSGSTQSALP